MAASDRDVRLGFCTMGIGLYTGWASFTMPSRGGLIESPGIFPGLMGLLLILFGAILIAQAWRKGGRLRPSTVFGSIGAIARSPEHRPVLMGIILPAVYVFVGIPLIGFYLSSALFMAVMFWLFVRSWRKWMLFLPISLGITGILYLTFNKLFQLQIW